MKKVQIAASDLHKLLGENLQQAEQITALMNRGSAIQNQMRKYKWLSEEQAKWIQHLEGRIAVLEKEKADGA